MYDLTFVCILSPLAYPSPQISQSLSCKHLFYFPSFFKLWLLHWRSFTKKEGMDLFYSLYNCIFFYFLDYFLSFQCAKDEHLFIGNNRFSSNCKAIKTMSFLEKAIWNPPASHLSELWCCCFLNQCIFFIYFHYFCSVLLINA